VDLLLTKPSQVSRRAVVGWAREACTSAEAAARPGLLRSLLYADRGCSCFREAGESQKDVHKALFSWMNIKRSRM